MKEKGIIQDIAWFMGVLVVALLVKLYVFTPVTVLGASMAPTLEDKNYVFALRQGEIERFDIVTFPAPDQPKKRYIKRVIGLPGDEIAFKNDQLSINGKQVAEPYLDEYKQKLEAGDWLTLYWDQSKKERVSNFSLKTIYGVTKVPEGKIFVMGDNRQISKDSRFKEVGFIDENVIIGNVKFSIWPPHMIK